MSGVPHGAKISLLAVALGLVAGVTRGQSSALLADLTTRYRRASTNGGHGRGNAARQQRAARKLKNIRARSSKRV